jgi:hypothetical protein
VSWPGDREGDTLTATLLTYKECMLEEGIVARAVLNPKYLDRREAGFAWRSSWFLYFGDPVERELKLLE